MNERRIDLDSDPDPHGEVRLQSGDCIISIWLPAPLEQLGEAMQALAEAGFDVAPEPE